MSGRVMDLGHGHTLQFTSWSPDRELNPQYDGIPDIPKIGAIVDTGAQRTAVSTKAALSLGVTETALAQDRSITIRGSAGEQLTAHIHRFAQLEVGGEITHNPDITVVDLNLHDADLVLGVDFLRTRRIWFSYGSLQIFLKRVTLDRHSLAATGM